MKRILVLLIFMLSVSAIAEAQIFKPRSRTVTTTYTVVDSLPSTIPFGHQVLYNGTMWRGLLAGESSLAAGTPLPVKGYKEYSGNLQASNTSINSLKLHNNDFDVSDELIFNSDGLIQASISTNDIGLIGGYVSAYDLVSGLPLTSAVGTYNVNVFFSPTIHYETSLDEMYYIVFCFKFYPPPPTP